jgi:hypothetical protein
MEFSAAQYQSAIDKIRNGLMELNTKIQSLQSSANAALSRADLAQSVRDAIRWLVNKVVEIVTTVVKKIIELLEGAAAPLFFFTSAYSWQTVRGLASSVVGNIRPEALRVNRYWSGSANDAYNRAVKPQSDAAARIATIGDKTSTSLNICAAAGLVFYVALGVIVYQLIVATVAAIAAVGSLVLSWAGVIYIVGQAAITSGMIIAAVASLSALLGAQASQLVVLHGEAIDASAFPGGQWPASTSDTFNDATVAGGGKWSLRSR